MFIRATLRQIHDKYEGIGYRGHYVVLMCRCCGITFCTDLHKDRWLSSGYDDPLTIRAWA